MITDLQLQNNVLAQLKWWPRVDAAHIGVSAKDGIVALTGQVSHYAEKSAAEESTKGVYGVKGLANDIVVEPMGTQGRSDLDIAGAAVNALKWHFEVPEEKIKVIVKNGWVTLEGTVDWAFQKHAAAECVRYLMGVVSLTNAIVIKPSATWTDVTTEIENAFRRHADLDARRITVTTKGSEVSLSGSVSSWSERDQAIAAAWAAPGVSAVHADLVVTT
ncbi:BON domain-containing protein [Variovorax sp. H27-G14]|uniref:BON domain-containing protein n=1 Tax=Variovorax sp. H27-G14 TaxID=3111914 RepID=UPI0038FCBE97